MSEETTIAKLISDEKISTESTTLDALKCYIDYSLLMKG